MEIKVLIDATERAENLVDKLVLLVDKFAGIPFEVVKATAEKAEAQVDPQPKVDAKAETAPKTETKKTTKASTKTSSPKAEKAVEPVKAPDAPKPTTAATDMYFEHTETGEVIEVPKGNALDEYLESVYLVPSTKAKFDKFKKLEALNAAEEAAAKKAEAEAAKKAELAEAAAQDNDAQATEPTKSLDELRKVMMALSAAGQQSAAKALLTEAGAAKLSALDPAQYDDVYAKAEALIAQ